MTSLFRKRHRWELLVVLVSLVALSLCWALGLFDAKTSDHILIHTEHEALAAAEDFVERNGLSAGQNERPELRGIRADRLKGKMVWCVELKLKGNVVGERVLAVLVYDSGNIRCEVQRGAGVGTVLEGFVTRTTR